MSLFKTFQLLAYEVPTGAYDGANVLSAWDAGPRPVFPGGMVGTPDLRHPGAANPAELADAHSRLDRFASVVERTYVDGGGANRWGIKGILKIFTAPEFYFRPALPAQSYAYSEPQAQVIMSELERMFRHQVFADWVFVCGTVVHFKQLSTGPVYFNTAVVVFGGPEGRTFRLEKQDASGIDGVPMALTPGQHLAMRPRINGYGDRRNHIIEAHGMELGLEICLEHHDTHRVLRKVIQDRSKFEPRKPPGVPLHILTAGGMPSNNDSIGVLTNGYLLRVDGVAGPPSSLLKVIRWRSGQGGSATPSTAGATAETQAVQPDRGLTIAIAHGLHVPAPPVKKAADPLPAQPWGVSVPLQQINVYPTGDIVSGQN
jgi:hypothetical protein